LSLAKSIQKSALHSKVKVDEIIKTMLRLLKNGQINNKGIEDFQRNESLIKWWQNNTASAQETARILLTRK